MCKVVGVPDARNGILFMGSNNSRSPNNQKLSSSQEYVSRSVVDFDGRVVGESALAEGHVVVVEAREPACGRERVGGAVVPGYSQTGTTSDHNAPISIQQERRACHPACTWGGRALENHA